MMSASTSRYSSLRVLLVLALLVGAYVPAKAASYWLSQRLRLPHTSTFLSASSSSSARHLDTRDVPAESAPIEQEHSASSFESSVTRANGTHSLDDPTAPYDAPACASDVRLLGVMASETPAWSVALLASASAAYAVGTGDSIPQGTVWFIAWDRVWLQRAGNICQLNFVMVEDAESNAPQFDRLPTSWRRIASVTASQPSVSRSIRLVHMNHDDKSAVRVFGTHDSSLLAVLGLRPGDELLAIDTTPIPRTDPLTFRKAWQAALDSDRALLHVLRKSKTVTISMSAR